MLRINVYHIPDIMTTLISVERLDNAGYTAHFGNGMCRIEAPNGKIIAKLLHTHGLYAMHMQVI